MATYAARKDRSPEGARFAEYSVSKMGHPITPAKIKRLSWDVIECRQCGLRFDPQKPR